MNIEKLSGNVKSKFAQGFKLEMDKLIEKALFKKEEIKNRGKTKGRFHFEASTNAGNWMIDKKWKYKANPNVKFMEDEREK